MATKHWTDDLDADVVSKLTDMGVDPKTYQDNALRNLVKDIRAEIASNARQGYAQPARKRAQPLAKRAPPPKSSQPNTNRDKMLGRAMERARDDAAEKVDCASSTIDKDDFKDLLNKAMQHSLTSYDGAALNNAIIAIVDVMKDDLTDNTKEDQLLKLLLDTVSNAPVDPSASHNAAMSIAMLVDPRLFGAVSDTMDGSEDVNTGYWEAAQAVVRFIGLARLAETLAGGQSAGDPAVKEAIDRIIVIADTEDRAIGESDFAAFYVAWDNGDRGDGVTAAVAAGVDTLLDKAIKKLNAGAQQRSGLDEEFAQEGGRASMKQRGGAGSDEWARKYAYISDKIVAATNSILNTSDPRKTILRDADNALQQVPRYVASRRSESESAQGKSDGVDKDEPREVNFGSFGFGSSYS